MLGVQMLHHDEGHAGVEGECRKELGVSLQAAAGNPDAHDEPGLVRSRGL
jgi:hypothetical protein